MCYLYCIECVNKGILVRLEHAPRGLARRQRQHVKCIFEQKNRECRRLEETPPNASVDSNIKNLIKDAH